MKNKETNRIHTKEANKVVRINYISSGFGHLRAFLCIPCCREKPRVTEYLLRKRNIEAHQENRPIYRMKTNDILSNQMKVCRPIFLISLSMLSIRVIPYTGDIVCECIEPDIYYIFLIKIYRNPPSKRRTGNTKILQSRL